VARYEAALAVIGLAAKVAICHHKTPQARHDCPVVIRSNYKTD